MSEEDHEHRPFHWRREEIMALMVPVVLLAVLAVAVIGFGFAGLITMALILVAVAFTLLMIITRG